MDTFNEVIPFNLDMRWIKDDTFTFLNNEIIVWLNEECEEGLDFTPYNGVLDIKYRPQDEVLETITTVSGEMIFTDNVITFDKPDLKLKVGEYFYSLKLTDKVDSTFVGTLFEGKFKVRN